MGRIVRAGSPVVAAGVGRAVAQAGTGEGAGRTGGDNYLERVAKYVPAEIVAFFIFVNLILSDAIDKEIVNATPESYPTLLKQALQNATMAGINVWAISWVAVGVGLVMIPLYLVSLRDPADPEERIGLNIVMAMAAFPVWAYAVDAVAFRPWHDGALASIVLATFSLISGAVSPTLLSSLKSLFRRVPASRGDGDG